MSSFSGNENEQGSSSSVSTPVEGEQFGNIKVKRKRMTLEEREKLKEQKLLEKLEKKRIADISKQTKPGECLKHVAVILETSLLSNKYSGEFLTVLNSADIKHQIKEQDVPLLITWSRKKVEDDSNVDECQALIVWTCDIFTDAVLRNSLCADLNKIKLTLSKKVTLIVFGIEEYFRLQKNEKNRAIRNNINDSPSKKLTQENSVSVLSRASIDEAVLELQIMSDISYRFVETGLELGTLIMQFTKAIAEKPFKLEKYKKEQNMNWYATADSKDCVRIENDGNGLLRLWKQQIRQFNSVGAEIVEAIVSQYKSPKLLLQAYKQCATQKEARLLLQNIPVRRDYGPLSSTRKVGPELSTKMYLMFNSENGEVPLF